MEEQDIRDALRQNLKKYRKAKNWTQAELAEKAGISEQTINSIEGLRSWPTDKMLAKISAALEVEMYRLFVPQRVAIQSEVLSDLKHAIAQTIEGDCARHFDRVGKRVAAKSRGLGGILQRKLLHI